jgi:hypothetical protein
MFECNDSGALQVVYLVKTAINIISLAAPIILIIMASIDILKIVTSSMDKTGSIIKKIVTRLLAALLIFFVPTLVNMAMSLLGEGNIQSSNCWKNATVANIDKLKAQEIAERETKEKATRDAADQKEALSAAEKIRIRTEMTWPEISSNAIADVGGVANVAPDQKLNFLFPNGVPNSESQMSAYITVIQVETLDAKGNAKTRNLTVHKSLAAAYQAIFKEIKEAGFGITSEFYAYGWREMATGSGSRSHHSYGVAVDMNVTENYMISSKGKVVAGSFWRPCPGANCSPLSIVPNGPVVKAFEKYGFTWGGNWSSSKDYMHFSYTGR